MLLTRRLNVFITRYQDPDGHSVRPEIKRSPNNVYNVTYTPESVGDYVIPITFNDVAVPNSPFKVKSKPTGAAEKVKFVGEYIGWTHAWCNGILLLRVNDS